MISIEETTFGGKWWAEAWALRVAVFVDEQKVPAEEESDEHDATAMHLVAVEHGEKAEVIGTLRIVRLDNAAKIGRVAVQRSRRGHGVGRDLMHAAMRRAKTMGYDKIILTAQVPVIGFYEQLGFVTDEAHGVFMEAGIPHKKMTYLTNNSGTGGKE